MFGQMRSRPTSGSCRGSCACEDCTRVGEALDSDGNAELSTERHLAAARKRYAKLTLLIRLGFLACLSLLVLHGLTWSWKASETMTEGFVLFARTGTFFALAVFVIMVAMDVGKRRSEAKTIAMLEEGLKDPPSKE